MRPSYFPNIVFVSKDAKDDAMTKRILERLDGVQVVPLEVSKDPITELNHARLNNARNKPLSEQFTIGKRSLLLTRHKGSWLKGCPGTSDHVCCNLFIVNPGEGCPLDCTYCYLQSYLSRNPTLKIYTNPGDLISEIEEKIKAQPNRLFRVGTGEVIDSLVWDELTDLSLELVPFFGRLPNGMLELKTKTSCVKNLLSMNENVHKGKTVVSWSVNAQQVTESDEAFTASLDERIAAAKAVVSLGYKVGFHFDPMIYFEGYQDAYRETVHKIFSNISPANIAWVSISTLRYRPEMQKVMIERFPESQIPFGEQFLASDQKLRYIQPLRLKLVQFVWDEIKSFGKDIPVYMCMESAAAWRTVAGGSPVSGSELVQIFSRNGKTKAGLGEVQPLQVIG